MLERTESGLVIGLHWFIVMAKQNQEGLVVSGLHDKSYEFYEPLTFERVPGVKFPKGTPLLRPYIFALLDVSKGEHAPIKNIRGVERLLADNPDKPEPLRDGGHRYIARLRHAEISEFHGASNSPIGRDDLKRGMHVRVDKQLLTLDDERNAVAITGVIEFIDKKKVEIRVDGILGRTIKVDAVDVSEIEPA